MLSHGVTVFYYFFWPSFFSFNHVEALTTHEVIIGWLTNFLAPFPCQCNTLGFFPVWECERWCLLNTCGRCCSPSCKGTQSNPKYNKRNVDLYWTTAMTCSGSLGVLMLRQTIAHIHFLSSATICKRLMISASFGYQVTNF